MNGMNIKDYYSISNKRKSFSFFFFFFIFLWFFKTVSYTTFTMVVFSLPPALKELHFSSKKQMPAIILSESFRRGEI